MCWCTPEIRTPCCGKTNCIPPEKYLIGDQALNTALNWANTKMEQQAARIEALEHECCELKTCLEREGERLDWVLNNISDAELSRITSKQFITFTTCWRDEIDRAMGGETK